MLIYILLTNLGCQPPDIIPSSFVKIQSPEIDFFKAQFQTAVSAHHSVLPLFAKRSHSSEILDFIDLNAADVFADIGVGTAALELAILEKNIPFKALYLIDVDKTVLDFVQFELDSLPQKKPNLHVVHSRFDNISVPKETLTKALLLNTPFYITEDSEINPDYGVNLCLQSIYDALLPNGTLYIIERHLTPDESLNVKENPEQLCQPLITPFTQMGFKLEEATSLQLDENNPHCAIKLKKPTP